MNTKQKESTVLPVTGGQWKVNDDNEFTKGEIWIASNLHGGVCKLPSFYGNNYSDAGRAEVTANANLIVAAVNACKSVNPSDPLKVAMAIPELVKVLKNIAEHDGFVGLNKADAMGFAKIANSLLSSLTK